MTREKLISIVSSFVSRILIISQTHFIARKINCKPSVGTTTAFRNGFHEFQFEIFRLQKLQLFFGNLAMVIVRKNTVKSKSFQNFAQIQSLRVGVFVAQLRQWVLGLTYIHNNRTMQLHFACRVQNLAKHKSTVQQTSFI